MTSYNEVVALFAQYNNEVQAEINLLQEVIDNLNIQNDDYEQTIKDLNTKVGVVTAEKVFLESEVARLQGIIDGLTKPKSTVLIGVSVSDEDHGFYPWGAAHCYNKGDVDNSQLNPTQAAAKTPKVSPVGAKAVCFSDSARWTTSALSAATVEGIRSDLIALRAKYPSMVIRYSWGNEVDRKVSNDAGIATYVNNVKLLRQMINGLNDPNITLWSSFTKGVFDPKATWIPTKAAQWAGIKSWVHGIAANLYPPSRDDAVLTADKVSRYPDFCDLAIKQAADWGVMFAVWETGHPVFNFPTNPAPYRNRPEYIKGLRDYVKSKCATQNVVLTEFCYWDQQLAGSGAPDNRLFHDAPLTANALNSV
jgi:hypothetical protein